MVEDMDIREDDLSGEAIRRLLEAHMAHATESTPAEFRFALDLSSLKTPDITFWSAWRRDDLIGCAALRDLGDRTGEIKSMHTAAAHRRTGVAAALVRHILDVAKARGYRTLFLETGSQDGHAAARALYLREGFAACGPFGDYQPSEHNMFMKREL